MATVSATTLIGLALGILLIFHTCENKDVGKKIDGGHSQGHHSQNKSHNVGANIIVLTYHRSGSSFVGEGLASHEKFSFYFEPLFVPREVFQNNTEAAFDDYLERLLTCDEHTLDEMRKQSVWIIRKFGTVWNTFKDEEKYPAANLSEICKSTPYHLTKTIRLRLSNAVNLYKKNTVPNLKIVHLVRDPRARYNSAHNPGGSWSDEEKSVDSICADMSADAKLIHALPKDVYRLLKYEDMAANPTRAIRDIYKHLLDDLQVSGAVKLYIRRHTSAEKDKTATKETSRYYSTFRNSTFDHEHWKTNLNASQIAMVQEKCKDVLKAYGYKVLKV